ncbi:MAG: PEGA domain-containing protein [Acidobacteriota bacterium]
MLGESNPIQRRVADHDVNDGAVVAERWAADTPATSDAAESAAAVRRTATSNHSVSNTETAVSAIGATGASPGKRWWLLAAVSALLLTALTAAGVYLVTKKPSTVDSLVILTVPSGAEIRLDSKDYGHSPVKLEQLAIGTYTLTISKEGFEPIVEPITVAESGPVEYKLKPVLPSETVNLPAEEQIKRFQQQAEDAFARGYYGLSYEGSALNYAEIILSLDPNSRFAAEMRERVRKAGHQSAQSAISRGDLAEAQEIYNFLVQNYPNDEEARAAAAKLETQLSELGAAKARDLVRKADEALQAGHLTDPARSSAYYYSKQALAIDRQNDKARQIRYQVKEKLATAGEQAYARGDVEAGIKQLEQVTQLFPEDKQVRARVRELQANRVAQPVKAADPNARRVRGLEEYRDEKFEDAIHDLEYAVFNGGGTPDVVFALARSYMRIGKLDQAESYFRKVPQSAADAYHSAIAALGDIALQRGDSATAVERWKEARRLGGSTIYLVAALDDKIEKIEKRQREKAAEPSPLTLQVKHIHGLLGGSCSGKLTIDSTGVRYDGEHVYTSSLVGAGTGTTKKDEMVITFQGNSQKFKVARADAERLREMLARYQQYYSPSNK